VEHGRNLSPETLLKFTQKEGQGACPPGMPLPLGERGGHSRNFHKKVKKKNSTEHAFLFGKLLLFPQQKPAAKSRIALLINRLKY
jgi:hypothetical protein